MNSTQDPHCSNDSIPDSTLPSDHPLYIDPTKKLTRFDLILMNNYKSIESYSSPYSTVSDTRSSTTYTSSKSLNDIDKTLNLNSDSNISEASTSIIMIPNITTTTCSTDDNEDDDNDEDEGASLSTSSDDENTFSSHHGYHHYQPPQQYSMERSFSDFGSLSTIPEVPTPITPASNVDNISFKNYCGGKEDSYEISFDNDRKVSTSSTE
uniref:Uncharacterized protein n=1 Tax=Panagrolaimus superbus TaxID=310955 RepID=A0A914YGL8_9BILA